MIYRIAILGNSGHFYLQITSSSASWAVSGGWTPITGTLANYGLNDTDPGQNFYMDGWRLGAEDHKFRQIGIYNTVANNDTLLIDTCYGADRAWEVWLAIEAGNLTDVSMKIWTLEGRASNLTIRTVAGGQQLLAINGNNDVSHPYITSIRVV